MSTAIVRFDRVTLGLGGRQLRAFSWAIEPFQSWVITGPNGSGKSLIVQALSGTLPITPCSAASDPVRLPSPEVTVCGIKRGSGESILEVKAKLGQVSYALHLEYAYQCRSNLLETVLSGFSNSVGAEQGA